MNLLRRVVKFLSDGAILLIPMAAVLGFFAGRTTEKNTARRVPQEQVIRIDDREMRGKPKVEALLARYKAAGNLAETQYADRMKRPLTMNEQGIHEWLSAVTLHPCPLPDDMLMIHADAIMRGSAELVLVPQK